MTQTRTANPAGTRLVRLMQFAPGILLILLAALFAAINPVVLSPANVINIVAQATPIAILAVGAMVVLVGGGIDLSAAYGVAFCSTLIASRIDAGNGLILALLVGLVVMVGIGFVIGLLVAYAKIPPFVATLAAMIALQGATLAVAQKGVLILKEPTLRWIGIARTGGIPNVIFVTAIVLLLAVVLMRRSRFGLRTYAIGSDTDAAELAGVPIKRQFVLVYVVSGVFVFLTAVLMISRVPVVTPNVGGIPLLLDAIAAAVLGGTSVFGGRGTVPGVIVGALIVSLVTTALRVFGTDPSSIELWKGVIIIAALVGDTAITRMRTRALLEARMTVRTAGEFRLDRMPSPRIAVIARDGRRPLAVLPVGAVEQHGPHLSTGVDIRLATAVAEAAIARTPDCYMAAPMPYGVSSHHRDFAGTMSLGAATFVAVLTELGGNLWADGFLPVFLNGHGGNRPALGVAVSTLGVGGVTSAAITYFEHIADTAAEVLPDAAGGTGHAGALETSLMLHVAPDEVAAADIPPGKTPDGWPDPHLYAGPAPTIWRPFSQINPTGVVGTPSEASEGAGNALFDAAVSRTSDLLSRIRHHYG